MLERMREGSQGIMAKVVLGFIILTFALAGIGGYLGGGTDVPAATVNGEDISRADFDRAYQSQRARMEQQFGEMFGQLAANETYMTKFREDILDGLISETLQTQMANSVGLRISDSKIKDIIRNMPGFQVAGRFDNDRYIS
ncbi:MAG: peptidyl-prolyl cis-trans isomerase D, partial [Phenylobacterium sp.]